MIIRSNDWFFYASYSYLNATYRSAITLGCAGWRSNGRRQRQYQRRTGRHNLFDACAARKVGLDYNVTSALKIGSDALIVSGQYYGGDEANLDPKLPGYTTVNLHASYQLTRDIQFYGLIDNALGSSLLHLRHIL